MYKCNTELSSSVDEFWVYEVNWRCHKFLSFLGDEIMSFNPFWGDSNPGINELQPPIVSKRDPTVKDKGYGIGQNWVNTANNSVWCLTSVTGAGATWTTSPASGSGTFAAVDITGGDLQLAAPGNIIVDAGNLTLTAGNASIGGNLDVTGNVSITGDFDITDTAAVSITSTANVAPSIYLHANGGVLEQIKLHSDQGTDPASVYLVSDVGGLTLEASNNATADAINLSAVAGGVDIDGALQVNIASSQDAADAIAIIASAGGISISATGAAGQDILVANTGGSVGISASEAAADAVVIEASDAAGGVQIKAGTGGIAIGGEADTTPISVGDIAPSASRSITIGGGTVAAAAVTDTIDIAPDGASTNADSVKTVNIGSGNVAVGENNVNIGTGNRASGTHLVAISTGTGTKTVNVGNADGLTTVNIDAIALINDSLNVNTSINTGTSTGAVAIGNALAGAMSIDSAAGISLDCVTASNFTVSGASDDLVLSSSAGRIFVEGGEAVADAVVITASDAAGGIDVNAGTAGITIDSTNLISIDAATASNVTVTGAGEDLTVSSVGGSLILTASEAVANAVQVTASDAAGGIALAAGTGGIAINAAGIVTLQPATASVAGTTLTINANVGVATFTGLTTASAGTETLTINNSLVSATSAVFVTVSNLGANDAQMTLTRVLQGTGSLTIQALNNGAAALNGNLVVSFWVIA